MSVDRTDYIIYGWKMPYQLLKNGIKIDLWQDKFLPYIEGWKDEKFSLIIDGMSGNYSAFGKLILSSNEGDGDGFNFQELSFDIQDQNEVAAKFLTVFGDVYQSFGLSEPKIIIFSHYS